DEIAGPEQAVRRPAADLPLEIEDARISPELNRNGAVAAENALGLARGTGGEEQDPGVAGLHRRSPCQGERVRDRLAAHEKIRPTLDRPCAIRSHRDEMAHKRKPGRFQLPRSGSANRRLEVA